MWAVMSEQRHFHSQAQLEDLCCFMKVLIVDVDMAYFTGYVQHETLHSEMSFEKTKGRPYFWCLDV